MNQIIEVKIKKLKINYIATCSQFPDCKGVGKTKQESLTNLANSISKYISDAVKKALNAGFSSNNFTEIIMDHTKEPSEEVIAYNFSSKISNINKNILFKVPSIIEEDSSDDPLDQLPDFNDLNESSIESVLNSNYKLEESVENDIYEELTFHQKSTNDNGPIVFGFPLNFN
ncbi:MAG: hypothetical protein VW397_08945 [Candidatus Margulisiibacteriota bacterium]